MKKYIYGICFLFTVLVTGQELKTKRIKEKVKGVKKTTKEYSVLRDDFNVKHGSYKEFFKKKLVVSGTYKNGKKEGEWVYKSPKETYSQSVFFENNKPSGSWKSNFGGKIVEYNKNTNTGIGSLSLSITKNIVPCRWMQNEVKKNKNRKQAFLDVLRNYVKANLNTQEIENKSLKGDKKVVVFRAVSMFKINRFGEIFGVKVKSSSALLRKEFKRVLENTPKLIPPHNINGEAVTIPLVLPIVFRL